MNTTQLLLFTTLQRSIQMSLRNKRRMIRVCYLSGSIVVLTSITSIFETPNCFCPLMMIFIALSFWPIRGLLYFEKLFIPTVTCRACGTWFDLTDHWKCSCGYVSEIPRHVFDRCSNCKKKFSYVICPLCGVSLDI